MKTTIGLAAADKAGFAVFGRSAMPVDLCFPITRSPDHPMFRSAFLCANLRPMVLPFRFRRSRAMSAIFF
jgi:hypothetical protein